MIDAPPQIAESWHEGHDPTTVFTLDLPILARLVGCHELRLIHEICGDATDRLAGGRSEGAGGSDNDDDAGATTAAVAVSVALVTAARRATPGAESGGTPKELVQLGDASLIIHSLRALWSAGLRTAVIVVAACGAEIIEHVLAHPHRPRGLTIE